MKIEKINDHQIRCTLNQTDLLDREIKLSELAYGTEKAQELFKDMMEQASFEFGFEVDNVPLMIEAIPLSTESIMLIITKVDDPDDLDTKFASLTSNITKFRKKETPEDEDEIQPTEMALEDAIEEDQNTDSSTPPTHDNEKKFSVKTDDPILLYSFNNLDDVSLFSKHLASAYTGINSLYKNPKNNTYYLVIHQSDFDAITYESITSIASEFGFKEKSTYATEAAYKEHYQSMIQNNAIQVLSKI